MPTIAGRFYNGKDGTYANVPMRLVNPNVFRGRQQYGSDVLIANWYEDRSKVNARQRKPLVFVVIVPVHNRLEDETLWLR